MRAVPMSARVIVASKNPVKVLAVREAFKKALPQLEVEFTGVASASGVADQPVGDAETLTGALNRIAGIGPEHAGDLVVALEGGVGHAFTVAHPLMPSAPQQENVTPNCTPGTGRQKSQHGEGLRAYASAASQQQQAGVSHGSHMECFAWAVVRAPTGAISQARSASFALPTRVAELVHQGMELGAADDAVFSRVNSGQGSGTIGRLTGGLITRTDYYEHAVLMALVPLMNPQLYPGFELPSCAGMQ